MHEEATTDGPYDSWPAFAESSSLSGPLGNWMPPTPKHSGSRSTSSVPSCGDSDVDTSPYLSHVVTHHGQLTLVPPQSQGRVRKDKKSSKAKPSRVQQSQEAAHTPQAGPPPSAISHRRKRSHQAPVDNNVSNGLGNHQSLRCVPIGNLTQEAPLEQLQAHNLPLQSPPSYESIRRHSSRTPSNDVISLLSSSSDEFEDIAVVDLESQWERDRLAGFTLEERVEREWHRRRATMEHTSYPPRTSIIHSTPPYATGMSTASISPFSDHSHSIQGAQSSSSQCSLVDWDVLNPVRSGGAEKSTLSKEMDIHIADSDTHSRGAESTDAELLSVTLERGPVYCNPSFDDSTEFFEKPLTRYKNSTQKSTADTPGQKDWVPSQSQTKDREASEIVCGSQPAPADELSTIHNCPLPTPPGRSGFTHSVSDTVLTPPSSTRSHEAGSSDVQSTVTLSSASFPLDIPIPASSRIVSSTPLCIRDGIARFESMRDRPVPPPPPDFLKTRVKRKPPPPPPSSFRLEAHTRSSFKNEIRPSEATGNRKNLLPPSHSVALGDRNTTPPGTHTQNAGPSANEPLLIDPNQQPLPSCSNDASESESPSPGRRSGCLSSSGDTAIPFGDTTVTPTGDASVSLPTEHPAGQGGSLEHSPSEDFDVPVDPVTLPSTESPLADRSLSQYTDLDILLSHLDDPSRGNHYEDLLLVSDILGPAQTESTPPSSALRDLPLGKVEVVRRRKLQDGRVKVKLSLLGVVVDRCHVCLSQFKDAEWAVLLPCLHPYHSKCLQSWLVRNHSCPLCRTTLDIPA